MASRCHRILRGSRTRRGCCGAMLGLAPTQQPALQKPPLPDAGHPEARTLLSCAAWMVSSRPGMSTPLADASTRAHTHYLPAFVKFWHFASGKRALKASRASLGVDLVVHEQVTQKTAAKRNARQIGSLSRGRKSIRAADAFHGSRVHTREARLFEIDECL